MSLRSDDAVMALFVVGAVVLVALAARFAMNGRLVPMAISLAGAALALFTYSQVDKVPQNLVTATPYVLTVIVLAGARQQLRPPAHAGLPYQPGTTH